MRQNVPTWLAVIIIAVLIGVVVIVYWLRGRPVSSPETPGGLQPGMVTPSGQQVTPPQPPTGQ